MRLRSTPACAPWMGCVPWTGCGTFTFPFPCHNHPSSYSTRFYASQSIYEHSKVPQQVWRRPAANCCIFWAIIKYNSHLPSNTSKSPWMQHRQKHEHSDKVNFCQGKTRLETQHCDYSAMVKRMCSNVSYLMSVLLFTIDKRNLMAISITVVKY